MVRYLIKIVLLSVFLAASTMMPAQNLPPLAKDGSITTGNLTNGISYYLVANPAKKGMADFALVRKGLSDTLSARKELTSLPHFNKTIPYKFLTRKGIGCGPEGYISYRDDNTLFKFRDVPMFDKAASDTTLLMLFDLIAEKPNLHSIIIAGDINPGDIIQKMNVFSLMVPSRNPSYKPKPYVWKPSEEMGHRFVPSNNPSVTLDFRSPRTPAEMMNTIQPFIARMYSLQLAEIVRYRLEDNLVSRNIPYSDLSVSFSGSDACSGDDHFKVSIETSDSHLIPASLALASTLSSIAGKGVEEAEFVTSKNNVFEEVLVRTDNPDLVDRCVSAYLYGADLASPATKIQFLTSRPLDSKMESKIFNDYIGAFLSDIDNAELTWTGREEDYDDWFYPSVFKSAWETVATLEKPTYSWDVTAADTLTLWSGKDKVKLKSNEAEPVSGGQMWTFSNGLRVIYKKTTSDRTFHYSLMVKGGYSSVRNLHKGEGAFFSDMLSLYDIAGMPGENFFRMLNVNGVEMSTDVSVSDMRISGSAPSGKFSLLMKSLLSIANDRRLNTSAFDKYCRKESARIRTAYLDSLLYPDFLYSSVKTPSGLTPQTQTLAASYFDSQFIKVNDGVLVLMGDLNEEYVQKHLCRILGGFRVSNGSVLRPSIQYKLSSGSTTYIQDSSPAGIKIAIAAAEPFTIENNMAFRIAVQALERSLAGVMAEYGFSVSSSERFTLNPQESVEAIISLTPVPEYSLPEGEKGGEELMMEALVAARKKIDEVLSKPLPAAEFNACKAIQASYYTSELADQGNYVGAVLMRYANSKDVLTRYNDRVNSVNADQVQKIFGVLAGGRRIEYVVR